LTDQGLNGLSFSVFILCFLCLFVAKLLSDNKTR
jgi:hypothetical protein